MVKMGKKELTWEEVKANLKLTPEEEEAIKIEEDIIRATIEARKNKNLTQEELSRISRIKQPAIARVEKHINSPQIYTILKLLYPMGYTLRVVPIEKQKK